MSALKVVYWGIKARGWTAVVLAKNGHVAVEWDQNTANAWPSTKDKAPFGQLPYIVDGEHVYGQSGAIYRIIARKGGLEGGNDHDFAQNQQIIEEYQDIWQTLAKPLYITDDAARAKAWEELETTTLPKHLGFLERLIGANGHFSSGDRLLVGDILIICLAAVISEIAGFQKVLAQFPKIKALHDHNVNTVIGDDLLKAGAYIVRK